MESPASNAETPGGGSDFRRRLQQPDGGPPSEDEEEDEEEDDVATAADAAAADSGLETPRGTPVAAPAPPVPPPAAAAAAPPQAADDDGAATAAGVAGGAAPGTSHRSIKACQNLDRLFGLREIGKEALCWQLSSAKPGNGVEQIRDESIDTYWQSDGNSQPHWIQVHFCRRVAISHVCLYLDYNLDESYTPKRLQVQVGMTNQDLISALYPSNTQIDLHEPVGWCIIPLSSPPDPLDDHEDDDVENDDDDDDDDDPMADDDDENTNKRRPPCVVRAHLLRISILSMHQNGRDTHVRQVQLYGPRMQANPLLAAHSMNHAHTRNNPSAATRAAQLQAKKEQQQAAAGGVPITDRDDLLGSIALSQFSTIR